MKYFAGMTRSEAMHMIGCLPDLTDDERQALIIEANLRPETRQQFAPQFDGPYHRRTLQRIAELKKYMMVHSTANRKEIACYFGMKGGNVDYVIAAALKIGVIEEVGKALYRGKE